MSAEEIIAELPKLSRHELQDELLASSVAPQNVWRALLEIAGTAEGLSPDLAEQHDHYLHGTPRR